MSERRTAGRILIVDDQPENVRVLAAALGSDYEVHFATSGEDALRMTVELSYDLILLDVVMPGIDGFSVLARLKQSPATRRIPVIFVTAADDIEDEEHGFELGAVDYIAKPISPPIVRARVRTHLELKQQRELLERRALIDGLTGIANRRHFDEQLEQYQRLATCEPLSILLLDVDFFKQYNDRYGHSSCDECLKRLAAVLPELFKRQRDVAARYGGEEFVVLTPGTDSTGCRQLAASLLSLVRDLDIAHETSSVAPRVTISIGATTYPPDVDHQASTFLESTDRLLYEAKKTGRDRCVHMEAASGCKTTIRLELSTGTQKGKTS